MYKYFISSKEVVNLKVAGSKTPILTTYFLDEGLVLTTNASYSFQNIVNEGLK